MKRPVTLLAIVFALATAVEARPNNAGVIWRIDPAKSEVRFTVTKFGFDDVTGVFRESEGQIHYDAADPAARHIRWRVRVASVLTDASNRDQALQSSDYFDSGRHPYLTFESRAVTVRPDRSLDVAGDITIRGVTKRITVHVTPRVSADSISFETDFALNRYDYGVIGGTVLGRLIGREVRVHLMAVGVAS